MNPYWIPIQPQQQFKQVQSVPLQLQQQFQPLPQYAQQYQPQWQPQSYVEPPLLQQHHQMQMAQPTFSAPVARHQQQTQPSKRRPRNKNFQEMKRLKNRVKKLQAQLIQQPVSVEPLEQPKMQEKLAQPPVPFQPFVQPVQPMMQGQSIQPMIVPSAPLESEIRPVEQAPVNVSTNLWWWPFK